MRSKLVTNRKAAFTSADTTTLAFHIAITTSNMSATEKTLPPEPSAPRRPPSPRKPAKNAKPFSAFAEDLQIHHTDKHGVHHAGSMGLFDDPDEIEAAERRQERHELKHHEAQIRRMQRQDERHRLKEKKEEKRIAQGKSPKPWYSRVLGRGKEQKGEAGPAGQGAASGEKVEERSASTSSRGREFEYVIVRKPSTPEVIYMEEDVEDVDSPWLEACGMVRVKSDDRGGCHIVPKGSIQSNEKKEQ